MTETAKHTNPIGVFDSGYGGLTILHAIREALPQYDYLYLGDNARAPYGSRSFDLVYNFTREAVEHLFDQGCSLVILACNTASAKALRSIQQRDLPLIDPSRRVLGVIRPTAEIIGDVTRNGHVGLFGTPGTVSSGSYEMEIAKLHPDFIFSAVACPMWVPLIENGEHKAPGIDYFIHKYVDQLLNKDPEIDTIILGCTHYPLIYDKLRKYIPFGIKIIEQGKVVAESLTDYLHRHPEIESRCSKGGTTRFLTTENPEKFDTMASEFLGSPVKSEHMPL